MGAAVRCVRACMFGALLLAGCGTSGGGGEPGYQPVSGAGPFRRIVADPADRIEAPLVLAEDDADFDDPFVLSDGPRLALWVTSKRGATTLIEHADASSLRDGFGPLQTAIEAEASWQRGAVSAPSVIAGEPWLLFFAAGGRIGWATAPDGHAWTQAAVPALVATAEEGDALGPPAAVRLGDRVRVYYPAGGRVFAAEAPLADLLARRPATWKRLDGNPDTPACDPVLGPAGEASAAAVPFAAALGRLSARAAETPAGRVRHDLYFTADTGTATTIGFAASFDGLRFAVAPQQVLAAPASHSPVMTPYLDGALLLFAQKDGTHSAIAAASSP